MKTLFAAGLCLLAAASCAAAEDEIDWSSRPAILTPSPKAAATRAPQVTGVKYAAHGGNLYLLIEGIPAVRDAKDIQVENGGKTERFFQAVDRWFVTLDGEQLDGQPWMIDFDGDVPRCSFSAASCRYLPKIQAVEVSAPLSALGVGPITLSVGSQVLYFAQPGMVGLEASFRIPANDGIVLSLPELPRLTGNPALQNVSLHPEPGCVGVFFESDRKVAYDVAVTDGSGKRAGFARSTVLMRKQRAYVVGLPPGDYRADISVTDANGRRAAAASDVFAIPTPEPAGKDGGWLRVAGKYIVDGRGEPVRLVGMARCQYLAKQERADFGDLAQEAAHYRSLGVNCIRLAVSPNRIESRGEDLYEELGPKGFVDQCVAPEVDAILRAGLYVAIDDHHIKATLEERDKWIPFWEEIARRYRDEPRVAFYELWNEANLAPSGLSPASGPAIRDWYQRCIAAIRKIDQRHILLVSDWNAGWGDATPSMWSAAGFQIDAPYNQVAFSKHMAKDHCTPAFVSHSLDRVEDQWNVPLVIGELELEPDLQSPEALESLLALLERNPRDYSVWLWRPHPDKLILSDIWSPWARRYAAPSAEEPSDEK